MIINEKVIFTHIRYRKKEIVFPKGQWYSIGDKDNFEMVEKVEERVATNREIRKSLGYPVNNFQELVFRIAQLGYENHRFNFLYRGQRNDYLDKNGGSKIYAKIYRPGEVRLNLNSKLIEERYKKLLEAIDLLKKNKRKLKLHPELIRYNEHQIALLQHYELCDTPFLDLTQSVRVAASFALLDSNTGYFFVFGVPHIYGSISMFVDQGISIVKLQNICPPEASRPHFQESYLIGRLPYSQPKEVRDNFAYRLIAKYYLDNTKNNFWNKNFTPIPRGALFPKKDVFENKLKEILKT